MPKTKSTSRAFWRDQQIYIIRDLLIYFVFGLSILWSINLISTLSFSVFYDLMIIESNQTYYINKNLINPLLYSLLINYYLIFDIIPKSCVHFCVILGFDISWPSTMVVLPNHAQSIQSEWSSWPCGMDAKTCVLF